MQYRDPILQILRRKTVYLFRKLTRSGIDRALEATLQSRASSYLKKAESEAQGPLRVEPFETLEIDSAPRFTLVRDDIYKRFDPSPSGPDTDDFGRKGRWIPRGSKVYFDTRAREYVKVFDTHFCTRGEGRFLEQALESGLYDFLCSDLAYLIRDESGNLRGYAIREGRQLTQYEFERYVGGSLREVICELTSRTGLYFLDLTCHNVILRGDTLSLIDLESVLPIEWFGKDLQFSEYHLDDVDIGWPLQKKWHSPRWYRAFLTALSEARP